jgi:hypothetical protein
MVTLFHIFFMNKSFIITVPFHLFILSPVAFTHCDIPCVEPLIRRLLIVVQKRTKPCLTRFTMAVIHDNYLVNFFLSITKAIPLKYVTI